ncbi:MAG: deoxyribodipyrimidine photo-lyase [Candidatus Thiodiazotropha sp.]
MHCSILWFRRDLRLTDNPALLAAIRDSEALLPIYIHAPQEAQPWSPGEASNWWLHNSLSALDLALRQLGSALIIARGQSLEVLRSLASKHQCQQLFFSGLADPALVKRDAQIHKELGKAGVACHEFNSSQLLPSDSIKRRDGGSYRVFTPFWRALQKLGIHNRSPQPAPQSLPPLPSQTDSLDLNALELISDKPWHQPFHDYWRPGEAGALYTLDRFLDESIAGYHTDRDRPDRSDTSRLSAHLHFGEVSPIQIATGIQARLAETAAVNLDEGANQYLRQLAWREFAIYLLTHFPQTDRQPFDTRFSNYPWQRGKRSKNLLELWQQGKTGIPIVDAGMRELWQTGWMHNRVRMIVASLLCKNLGIHWLEGARWFWDTLVDADLANNSLGWQWSAGCGADAAPYFRIFNPLRQAERFDPDGVYIRHWLPELSGLSKRALYAPWEANTSELLKVGIRLGKTYPKPMIDLQSSRQKALQRWERIKRRSNRGG